MYIYHALINALSAHMIHINLNTILYTHVEHSPKDQRLVTETMSVLSLSCCTHRLFDIGYNINEVC